MGTDGVGIVVRSYLSLIITHSMSKKKNKDTKQVTKVRQACILSLSCRKLVVLEANRVKVFVI